MSMTNQQLEGRAERAITRLIDHPNWQTFKEAGYPWGRVEEFFGLEGKQLNDASSAFMDESMFREKEDDRPHIDDTDIDFAPEVFMEHERHNIVNHPDGGHSHEMLPTFGNVNINQPSMADGVGVGPDMQNIPLQDGEEDMFSPWNERYKGQRIGPHSRTPFSEQDQMKYASEPFDQAWALLKGQYPRNDPRIQGFLKPQDVRYPTLESADFANRIQPEIPSRAMEENDARRIEFERRFDPRNIGSNWSDDRLAQIEREKEKEASRIEREDDAMRALSYELDYRQQNPENAYYGYEKPTSFDTKTLATPLRPPVKHWWED